MDKRLADGEGLEDNLLHVEFYGAYLHIDRFFGSHKLLHDRGTLPFI